MHRIRLMYLGGMRAGADAGVVVAPQPPEVLGLLSDPLRWALVVELGRSDRRVGELVERVGKRQSLVSYHLAELRRAGIVSARRSSADGRDVYYRADLLRCRELLGTVGPALHPGLSLATTPPDGSGARRRRARPRLLFLCTGNSARSRWPRRSSSTARPATWRPAAPAATPSRCTPTRCGSWPSAASTSPAGRPRR
jgi:DNA-binding transcriptional ArsR family regulator